MKDISVRVDEVIDGIIANIIGEVDFSDIDLFKTALLSTINNHFPFKKFTLLINGNGYLPINLSVHAYYSKFLKNTKLIVENCKAVAHVHHSQDHINDCLPLMTDFQGFFVDFKKAHAWLRDRK
jgi:hypothetical protein